MSRGTPLFNFFFFFFNYDLLWLVHIKIGVNIFFYIYIYTKIGINIEYKWKWCSFNHNRLCQSLKKKITFLSVNLKILYANLCTWHASYSQNNSKTNFPPLGFWIAFEANFLFKKKDLFLFWIKFYEVMKNSYPKTKKKRKEIV